VNKTTFWCLGAALESLAGTVGVSDPTWSFLALCKPYFQSRWVLGVPLWGCTNWQRRYHLHTLKWEKVVTQNGLWVYYLILMLWPLYHTVFVYKFICILRAYIKYVKCFLVKICLTRQSYCCLWVQRNRIDNKVNWRLGKSSHLYFCKSTVAIGMFFLAWCSVCFASDTARISDTTASRRRGLWGYLFTRRGALELVLRWGVWQREITLYAWNMDTIRWNWSPSCLLEELWMEKTLRFSVNSAFSFWHLAICFLKKSN